MCSTIHSDVRLIHKKRNFSYQDLGNISGGSSGAEEKGGTGDWGFGYDYEREASGKLSGASLLCDSL